MTSSFTSGDVLSFADQRRRVYERQLSTLVNLPTVSAQRERHADIERCAEEAAALIVAAGGNAKILRTASGVGNPVVHGTFGSEPAHPTVTVYNHLDVQPADAKAEGWTTPPFELTIDGDIYRGRGSTDDKGPALAALHGAEFARSHGVPANIHFLWEFEEEIGSPNFSDLVAQHRERLATHSVVVSDTVWVSREQPAAPAGLRGLQGFLFRLRTGAHDAHSGLAGGAARNPIAELMEVVTTCFDARTGDVKIPGFYDDVVAPTEQEMRDFKTSGFSIERFKRDHGFTSLRSSDPLDVMMRLWARPTFEVHGVTGGYAGEGIKTIVPPSGEVKVSCRLVPAQSAARIIEVVRKHVAAVHPEVEVIPQHGLEAFRGRTQGPLPDAIRDSIEFAFGKRPVFVREGGAIGAVVSMNQLLDAPVVFLGLSLPEHGYHAPNEFFDWGQARGGIAAFAEYFRRVAALGRNVT